MKNNHLLYSVALFLQFDCAVATCFLWYKLGDNTGVFYMLASGIGLLLGKPKDLPPKAEYKRLSTILTLLTVPWAFAVLHYYGLPKSENNLDYAYVGLVTHVLTTWWLKTRVKGTARS